MQSGPREKRFTPCGPWAEMSLTPLLLGVLCSHSLGVWFAREPAWNFFFLFPLFWSGACDTLSETVTSSRLFFPYIFSLYGVNPKKMAIFLEFPNI